VDAAPAAATGSCPNGAGVSCKGRDSVRSTWRGNCRALVEGDLLQARKKKGISQEDLAGYLGTKGPAIGRYERDEMKPSIDAATKMAKVLGVSLDWLVGNTDDELDTATLHRIQDINKLSQKDKELVFEFLDSFISNRKIKKALG
jgi:transcriptional regulator with XRE-family HTH domain